MHEAVLGPDEAGGSFLKASDNYWEVDGMDQAKDSSLEAGRIEFGWSF